MKLAVLAGNRTLPLFFCEEVRKSRPDIELIAFAFINETNNRIKRCADRVHWIHVTSLEELTNALKEEHCSQAVMVGQINPLRIFKQTHRWDSALKNVMEAIPDVRPHTVFTSIIAYLEKEGLSFLDYGTFLKDHFAHLGTHTSHSLDPDTLGLSAMLPLIKNIVNTDIGQTIVIKNKTIVSVEAIEGTDNTIKRGYRLAGKGCIVIKSAKDKHDMRFDIPVIGPHSIQLLRQISALGLFVEADKVLFINKQKTIEQAEKLRVPICGISFS